VTSWNTTDKLKDFTLEGWDDSGEEWVTLLNTTAANNTNPQTFNFTEGLYSKFRFVALSTYTAATSILCIKDVGLYGSGAHIEFDTAPANGLVVDVDYDVEYIPKDVNHVVDIGFAIQFGDGNV
jgi:hypothetical protein